jgi:hypothetical protein
MCAAFAGVEHVVIIGVDGLSPDGTRNARAPTFQKLIGKPVQTAFAPPGSQ